MNDYSIWEVSNGWFKSHLSNCNQFVFVNGYDFVCAAINCGVSQYFIQGLLLFLLFINDLNQTIKFCKIHHFADDKNLLCLDSIRKLNKLVNADLTKKAATVIFKSKQNKFEGYYDNVVKDYIPQRVSNT